MGQYGKETRKEGDNLERGQLVEEKTIMGKGDEKVQ